MPTQGLLRAGQSVNESTRAVVNQRMQTASLSRPNDMSLLFEGDIGRRMRNVVFTTAVNAGFERLTCRLMGRGGLDPTEAEAEAIVEGWRFGLLRFNLRNEAVWTGRIVNIEYDYPGTNADGMDLCPLTMQVSGLYSVLTDIPANLPSSYTDPGGSSSAAQLVIDGVTAAGWPIRPIFSRVASTGINLGPLRSNQQDTWLDVITNALTAGGTDGITYVLLIKHPEDGPRLIPYGVGLADFRVPIRGLGVRRGWNGEEQAWRVSAVYSGGDGSGSLSDPASDTRFIQLHNGVARERVISLSGMAIEAANNGALSFLAQHGNPVAMTGSPRLAPNFGEPFAVAQLAEGGLVPAWRLHAGHLIRLLGYRRFDAEADNQNADVFAVETTSYDVEAGVLTLTLDQRAVRSSLAQSPGRILELRGALEPGFAHTSVKSFESATTTLISNLGNVPIDDANGSFTLPGATVVTFHISVTFDDGATSTARANAFVGLTVDTEDWVGSDPFFADEFIWPNGLNTGNQTEVAHVKRTLPAGPHTFQIYAWVNAGSYSSVHVKVDIEH